MKFSLVTLILAPLLPLLGGCGITDVAEKTHNQVVTSNKTQTELLDYMKRTYELTEQMKGILKTTEDGIHLQILSISLEQMLHPNNTQILNPPFRMMPFAESFTKEATPDELIRSGYLLLQEATFGPVDQNTVRLVSLVAMSSIAGFVPQAKLEQILKLQVDDKGPYEETAYALVISRYNYLRDFRLNTIVEKSAFLNVGTLKEAVDHFKNIKYLVDLPYVEKCKIDIEGLGVHEAIDAAEWVTLGKRAVRIFKQKMTPADLQLPAVEELLKNFG